MQNIIPLQSPESLMREWKSRREACDRFYADNIHKILADHRGTVERLSVMYDGLDQVLAHAAQIDLPEPEDQSAMIEIAIDRLGLPDDHPSIQLLRHVAEVLQGYNGVQHD